MLIIRHTQLPLFSIRFPPHQNIIMSIKSTNCYHNSSKSTFELTAVWMILAHPGEYGGRKAHVSIEKSHPSPPFLPFFSGKRRFCLRLSHETSETSAGDFGNSPTSLGEVSQDSWRLPPFMGEKERSGAAVFS